HPFAVRPGPYRSERVGPAIVGRGDSSAFSDVVGRGRMGGPEFQDRCLKPLGHPSIALKYLTFSKYPIVRTPALLPNLLPNSSSVLCASAGGLESGVEPGRRILLHGSRHVRVEVKRRRDGGTPLPARAASRGCAVDRRTGRAEARRAYRPRKLSEGPRDRRQRPKDLAQLQERLRVKARMQQPSNLISCSQLAPSGAVSATGAI